VYRYLTSIALVFAPLNAVSIDIDSSTHLRWAQQDGGPLRFDSPGPDTYALTIGDPGRQGLLCVTPGQTQLEQLLQVPRDIDPKTMGLARTIVGNITDPLEKARAIEAYLPQHHAYSQHILVNAKDPLGDFLFSDKAAHCEFFASAAVILMRCVGVPARYVIGYYAHEEEDGDIVVRQRDAHAWAECWIKGTGWVTIDATPGSGRPNGEIQSIPTWKHTIERIQDWFIGVKQKFTAENLLRAAGLFISLALVAYLLQNRYHFSFKRVRRVQVKEYAAPSPELLGMYRRFEAICRKHELNCPPNIPWQQFLALELNRHSQGSPAERSASGLRAAADFMAEYNRARFGGRLSADTFDELNKKLDRLVQDIKRGDAEEMST
jgi:transglutaminase-like putative cysteine protease